MTDNEIVKALEEDIELRFNDDTEYATVRLGTLKNALDLINRLQADLVFAETVARARHAKIKKLSKKVVDYMAENERLKAEAVREFAERVKTEFYYEFEEIIPSVMADKIDNLLEEKEKEIK